METEENIKLLEQASKTIFDISAKVINHLAENLVKYLETNTWVSEIDLDLDHRTTPNKVLTVTNLRDRKVSLYQYRGFSSYGYTQSGLYYLDQICGGNSEALGFRWDHVNELLDLYRDFSTKIGGYNELSVILTRVSKLKITAEGVEVIWAYRTDRQGTKHIRRTV